ncbi:MAG: AAA family ATPase [Planctomycetota bacterium]|nr:MAG: AAA family ATPase [Planctomycetota bacterium]
MARVRRTKLDEAPPEREAVKVFDGPVVLGQEHAVHALTTALASAHFPHAWIFHGPAGTGKFLAAIELARLLLDGETTRSHIANFKAPRGTRVSELIDVNAHPDLHVIRKELAESSSLREVRERKQTNIPLDLLRELMLGGPIGDGKSLESPIWKTAYLGHGKVFIIDEAELLDVNGQNALLKTLEEPPAGTYIVLCTTQEDRLLPTIRSRCQRVAFSPLSAAQMDEWMERAEVPTENAAWIRTFADGSPGVALLAAKYELEAWATEIGAKLDALERGRFDASVGEHLAARVDAFAEAVVKENPKSSKEAANRLGFRMLALILARRLRDTMQRAASIGETQLLNDCVHRTDLLARAETELRSNVNLKQLLANLAAQWALPA